MSKMIQNKIEELRRQLTIHNYKYYVENAPELSDYEFDKMLRDLQTLEDQHPEYADPNSPTQRVGSDISNTFESAEHRFPMLSLSNTYSLEELQDFTTKIIDEIGEVEFVCELKFDGTAISLTYENGELLRAVTRGDGSRGDDVTRNVRTIQSVPLKLIGEGYPAFFEIRGEILLPYSSFDRLNVEREANDEPPFANPRNAAAGTLKQQSSAIVAKRGLDCFLYQIAGNDLPFESHWDNLKYAHSWGFNIADSMRLCHSTEEIAQYIEYWDKERKNLPFATDGIVIKVNKYKDQRALGFTAKAPKWAVAYKFKAEHALTKLLSVDYQVGRTGAITPVANLDPVQLAGTTVKRASLHNAEQIAALDIRVGDMVYVEKGGEIIPKITGVELANRTSNIQPLEYISTCPECGTELVKFDGEAKHYCPNQSHCPPQIVGRIIHFIRRKAMNIDGLGDETVELLFQNGLLKNIADIYDLRAEQLASLPRLGAKSADNIINSIEESKSVPFARVLFAMGIRFVGETTAKYLAKHFGSLEKIACATKEELIEAEEVGDKIADSIIEYFADSDNCEIVRRLSESNIQTAVEEQTLVSETFTNKNFVVSGKFSLYTRDEIKALIESHGGKILAAVSANVNYIVAGDKMGPAKLQKAKKLGLEIIDEAKFVELLGSIDQSETKNNEPTKALNQENTKIEEEKVETPSITIEKVTQGELF